ncbi:unnamed protein product [Staurois parvus]|uniref:Uncharacterized protein n=1 Tax=Staurois parvus TaxID=386267 RepID=A0ABN9D3B2_9NEOB|nr:unnamed protein product [Staurois parvus]
MDWASVLLEVTVVHMVTFPSM